MIHSLYLRPGFVVSKFVKKKEYHSTLEFRKFEKAYDENLQKGLDILPPVQFHLDYNAIAAIPDFQTDISWKRCGFFVTDKGLAFLQKYNLPKHSVFPVTWSIFGREKTCNYFFIHHDIANTAVLSACKFRVYDSYPGTPPDTRWVVVDIERDIVFSTLEQKLSFVIEDNPHRFKKLGLQELAISDPKHFELDLIYIGQNDITERGIFFSERLKNDLEASDLTGINFPYPIITEVYKVVK